MSTSLIALCIVAAVQVSSAYEEVVPLSQQPYGGNVTAEIVWGRGATKYQFPHQAAITIDYSAFCGGSLISGHWVLTAAHCVDGYSVWTVVLGAHVLRYVNESGRVTLTTLQAIAHEDYTRENLLNDIGLIRLPKGLDCFNEQINAIPLPPRSYQNEDFAGQIVRVSGWGKIADGTTALSTTLQCIDLALITLEQCRSLFGEKVVTNTKYCTSGGDGMNLCNGDGGSSVTIGTGRNLSNLGIVSFGAKSGCTTGYPSGYTATPFFLDWISSKTGIPIRN